MGPEEVQEGGEGMRCKISLVPRPTFAFHFSAESLGKLVTCLSRLVIIYCFTQSTETVFKLSPPAGSGLLMTSGFRT